jgi:hypothetical protein
VRGILSFHPVDLAFFDETIAALAGGRKINPEAFLQTATRIRRSAWVARGFPEALVPLAAAAEAPRPDAASKLWTRIRTNLERIDYKPDVLARKAADRLDPDLHLHGRPFFITEVSAERVASTVAAYCAAETEASAEAIAIDQMTKLDADLGKEVRPQEQPYLGPDPVYRNDLLAGLKRVHDLGREMREGASGGAPVPARGRGVPPAQELPWRAVHMHAKVAPFWIARDVDGLETICRASGVAAPDFLSPAWRLFAEACDAHPPMRDALRLEVTRPRDVGGFVAPSEIDHLIDFLTREGSKIIGAATRAGEGTAATTLLKKIKECAVYAQRNGCGYLEASGILPPDQPEIEDAEA